MNMPTSSRVVHSMLWAAYGDALGFMSELVDERGLQQRMGQARVERTVPWSYRVGGRYGTSVQVPAGMYSDDTQLRLATARAIGGGAVFNVDAFAKVELPVWMSYALGGGTGTKAAAANLARDNVPWYANFYSQGSRARYLDSGGNGAAMRIQPHVWAAAPGRIRDSALQSVLRNAVITHGHPRALVGAALHASALSTALTLGEILPPPQWGAYLEPLQRIYPILADDSHLGVVWLAEWERNAGGGFCEALKRTVDECSLDIDLLSSGLIGKDGAPKAAYLSALDLLGGYSPASRGSGTKTAIASIVLAWLYRAAPEEGLVVAANALGSDTDTIASMAGALLGAIAGNEFPEGCILADRGYLEAEARRLQRIADGEDLSDFEYPSLLTWRPPRSASDAAGVVGDGLGLAGLGSVAPIDERVYGTNERGETSYRWCRTRYNQTLLIKFGLPLRRLTSESLPLPRSSPRRVDDRLSTSAKVASVRSLGRSWREEDSRESLPRIVASGLIAGMQGALFASGVLGQPSGESEARRTVRPPPDAGTTRISRGYARMSIEELTSIVIKVGFDPALIGEIVNELSDDSESGIDRAIAFVAIVAKARWARRRRPAP